MLPYLAFIVVLVLMAPFAYVLAPHDPTAQSLSERLATPAWLPGGNPKYFLGSDGLGRDIFSRIVVGAQVSLAVGCSGVLIGSTLGTILGVIAGFKGKVLDDVITAVADVQLSFPFILLAIAIIAVLGPAVLNVIVVVGLAGWVTYARVCRSATLRLRNEDFILAVRAIGGSDWRIVFRHILPNYLPTLIVIITLQMPSVILLESTLSFLGLGVQPPTPSWGSMVSEGRNYLGSAWWISAFPGFALMLTTLSINRIGDWLRVALDPVLKRAA